MKKGRTDRGEIESAGHCKVSKQRGYVRRVPQAFSLTRRASKHFSLRWKASSRSSCHVSSFLAKLRSTISRWGVYVKDFFLSPYQSFTLFHSSSSPHPRLPVCLIFCQYVSPSFFPSPSCSLQFSFCLPQDVSKPLSLLSVSPSLFPTSFSQTLLLQTVFERRSRSHLKSSFVLRPLMVSNQQLLKKGNCAFTHHEELVI